MVFQQSIGMIRIKDYFFITLTLILLEGRLLAQERVEGVAIMRFTNSKGINHPINEDAKFRLMQSAIFDAIEKGSRKKISVLSYNKVAESTTGNNHFDTFISTTLQKSGVSWKRDSDYQFQLVGKKEWKCTVTGTVENLDVTDTDFMAARDFPEQNKIIVTKRGVNTVHINSNQNIGYGQLIGISKVVKTKVLNDYDSYKKTKALVYITKVGSDFSVGRIIKGFYRVKVGDEVVVSSGFKKSRLGIKFDYTPLTQLNLNTNSISVGFFAQSYVSRFGLTINCDMLQYGLKSQLLEPEYMLIPNAGATYHFSILPDLLYLVPEFNMGYVVKAKDYDAETITINPKLAASLRLKIIEISAGAQYRFFLDDIYSQSGLYPFASINFSLNKN
jgi:hypothetical protein